MDSPDRPTAYRLLHWLVNGIWALAVFVLLLLALYAGIGRYLVTQVGAYEADLENFLSQRSGRQVQIDRLSGSWAGLDPIIQVEGLAVGDPNQPDAILQRLQIRLSTTSSLVRGRLVFSEFSASHADLTLTQDQKGVLGLSGLWQPPIDEVTGLELIEAAVEDFDSSFSDWIDSLGKILADPVVRVSDLRLTLQTPDHPDQFYQIPAIDLAFRRGVFSAEGRLNRIDTSETIAWFTLEGRHFFSGKFDGSIYVDVRSERLLDAFLQRYEWFEVGVEGLSLRTAAWLTFTDGQLNRAVAEVDAPYLQLRSATATLPPIENFGATLAVARIDADCPSEGPCPGLQWDIQIEDLQYRWNGHAPGPVNARWYSHSEGWELELDRAEVDALAELVVALDFLPRQATQALTDYRPRGRLTQIAVSQSHQEGFHLRANLRQVGVDAHGGAPAIEGLEGWLEHDSNGGRIVYDAADVIFGFPELFAGAWRFERMTGEVTWRDLGSGENGGRVNSGWQVEGEDLRFQYTDETVMNGSFQLVLAPSGDRLGLKVGVLNARQKHLAQFIPVGAVGEPLYDWLTGAIVAGDIPWGWYYGAGALGPGPETATGTATETGEAPFTSAMVYDFDDLEIRYSEGWPALQQGQGQFRYQAGLGWADIQTGTVGGLEPIPTRVRIDTRKGATRVDVASGAQVSGKQLQQWLDDTELGALAGDSLDDVVIDGIADLVLELTVVPGLAPAPEATRLSTRLTLEGVSVLHQPSELAWQDITGVIKYDSLKGLSAEGVKGRFLSHEARFELAGGGVDTPVELHQWGRASVAELETQLGQPLPAAKGSFNYDLRVLGGSQPALGFQLDLADIAIDLPTPLGKTAGEPALIQGNLVAESEGSLRVQGAWTDVLAYQLIWDGSRISQGSVFLGQETAPLRQDHYVLGGFADRVDVDEWLRVLGPALDESPLGAGPQPGPEDQSVATSVVVALSAGNLVVGGSSFGSVDLGLVPEGEGWRIDLQGERLAGKVFLRNQGAHLLELERLKLGGSALTGFSAGDASKEAPPTDRVERPSYPRADVAIDELWLGDANYGRWNFQVQPSERALTIGALEAHTGSLVFKGELVWQYQAHETGVTSLVGELDGGNINDLSAWLDAGVPLNSRSTKARLNLVWPGSPQQFSLAAVEGEMALGLEEGTILDQNNVAQVFRLFGILNADTLLRRLRLDFSDLYKAGVAFEAVSGSAVVGNGILTLNPELQLTGPSGAFRLTGSTSLVEESLDMRLVVVLPLTQNLPVAALLLGAAAPVGGALFILDKLLGDPLSKLTSATYDVSGDWDKPEVKLRSIFDTGPDRAKSEPVVDEPAAALEPSTPPAVPPASDKSKITE